MAIKTPWDDEIETILDGCGTGLMTADHWKRLTVAEAAQAAYRQGYQAASRDKGLTSTNG